MQMIMTSYGSNSNAPIFDNTGLKGTQIQGPAAISKAMAQNRIKKFRVNNNNTRGSVGSSSGCDNIYMNDSSTKISTTGAGHSTQIGFFQNRPGNQQNST